MGEIIRDSSVASYALTAVLGTTAVINYERAAAGYVGVPTGSSITSLTFYASDTSTGTFRPCYTSAGVAITMSVAAARAYALPDSLYPFPFLKIVADASGTITLGMKT